MNYSKDDSQKIARFIINTLTKLRKLSDTYQLHPDYSEIEDLDTQGRAMAICSDDYLGGYSSAPMM